MFGLARAIIPGSSKIIQSSSGAQSTLVTICFCSTTNTPFHTLKEVLSRSRIQHLGLLITCSAPARISAAETESLGLVRSHDELSSPSVDQKNGSW